MTTTLSASFVLCQRELIRFVRQKNRVIGSLVTPIVFWAFIGLGMGNSFAGANGSTGGYSAYFFAGTVLLSLLFTAIFSTISVIEDRREGFLQGVLVAPVGRIAIVGGKIFGGAVMATGQAMIFLLLGVVSGVIHLTIIATLAAIGVMFLASIGLTALGLFIAWKMSSTQGFHVIMNIFLMPMWMLSGALFPLRDDMPRLFKIAMLANPLTYALACLRYVFAQGPGTLYGPLRDWQLTLSITVAATCVMVALTIWIAQGRSAADAA